MESTSRARLVIITGVVLLLLVPLYLYLSNPLFVTVSGVGEVDGAATKATVSFTVNEAHFDPVTANTNLQAKVATFNQLLLENNFRSDDIVTTQPQIVPVSQADGQGTVYQATVSMAGSTDRIGDIASLVALLYQRGAVLVSQPVLTVDDAQDLEKQAVEKAMADASTRAGAIARKHWKLIKTVANIAQTDQSLSSTASTKGGAYDENAQVLSDSIKVVKSVTVTYKMW